MWQVYKWLKRILDRLCDFCLNFILSAMEILERLRKRRLELFFRVDWKQARVEMGRLESDR